MLDQIIISLVILTVLFVFTQDKWRQDVVAMVALFSTALLGLVKIEDMFLGFIHPIIILIVSMLVLSKALINSGVVDYAAKQMKFADRHPIVQLGALLIFTVFLSAFINSIGALAFVIPIAIKMSRQSGAPLSMFLMPVAFASHLGGSVTLIGSASNIIVSGIRAEQSSQFGFFEFAPVAIPIALAGILFMVLIGWRLIPKRESAIGSAAEAAVFITELKIPDKSKFIGQSIDQLKQFSKEEFEVIALERYGQYYSNPKSSTILQSDDVLMTEIDPSILEEITTTTQLEIKDKQPTEEQKTGSQSMEVMELVVPNDSPIVGETAAGLGLRENYRLNLLALHRSGGNIRQRMGRLPIGRGDILIVQAFPDRLNRFIKIFGLMPLREREFHLEGKAQSSLIAGAIFLLAIIISISNLLPIHIVFAGAALACIITKLVPMKQMYNSVDLSMIVLFAIMIQLSSIFHDTGATASLGEIILFFSNNLPTEAALAIVFLITMWLSDIFSNSAVAIFLAPVALAIAANLGVNPDPFLVAVAIAAGSSYLSPSGHHSNLFVMNMGGYRFSDYKRLGLPLEVISFVVGYPLILYFFPF